MGCDIHLMIERKRKQSGDWVPVDPPVLEAKSKSHVAGWDEDDPFDHMFWYGYHLQHRELNELWALSQALDPDPYPMEATKWYFRRDYNAFARLAGVRNQRRVRKMALREGHPIDLSTGVRDYFYDGESGELWADFHTETWAHASEIENQLTADDPVSLHVLMKVIRTHVADVYDIPMHDVRVIIGFDN